MSEHYQTLRLFIRPTSENDIDRVLEMERDQANADFIRYWTREKHLAALNDDNIGHFTVELKDDHKIIGHIILVGLTNPDNNIEFKRIVIAEKGKGYGHEAVHWIKKYAFEVRGTHRLWLEVMENNSRAYDVYLAEGFIKEGVHRESLKQGENYISLIVMSILAGEYRRPYC
jgi:diamine N-acetyltransferase